MDDHGESQHEGHDFAVGSGRGVMIIPRRVVAEDNDGAADGQAQVDAQSVGRGPNRDISHHRWILKQSSLGSSPRLECKVDEGCDRQKHWDLDQLTSAFINVVSSGEAQRQVELAHDGNSQNPGPVKNFLPLFHRRGV